ncbi:hypothetical protein PRUPE_7G038900 [Prunus persica]|uniref:Uncharacterized protein n=1 Tax=Prunus persica TaxID=3760 RepID=A0A251N6D7_PRUPE|nr:hypothetical protein PRUPE_7G038900 [Prunus persica]
MKIIIAGHYLIHLGQVLGYICLFWLRSCIYGFECCIYGIRFSCKFEARLEKKITGLNRTKSDRMNSFSLK